ncbi:hypothetical protein ACEPAG_8745 [Sanghuangporus baumii]
MPTSSHALLVNVLVLLLCILSSLVQAQHAPSNSYPVIIHHPRADNTTEIQTAAKNRSTSTFLTALWTNGAIFAAELIAFSFLRPHFTAIYEPRTYVPRDESKRSEGLGRSPFSWPIKIWNKDFHTILRHNGVDAYLFVRFQRMMVQIFGPIWIISWAVLLPVTGVNGGADNDGLDRFTFGNIGKQNQTRYWAHLACAWVFTIWICGVIYREMKHFIATRQEYLVSEMHSSSEQANTILITGISDDYLSVQNLMTLFSHLPGGVRKVWLNRNLKELPNIYKRRMKACDILEKAETKLVRKAMKVRQEQNESRKRKKRGDGYRSDSEFDRERGLSLAEKIVPKKDWPKHRLHLGPLPFAIPLLSKKVDTIDWAREEIIETTRLLKRGRRVIDRETGRAPDDHRNGKWFSRKDKKETYPALNSAFILFNQQISAHLAIQALIHHEPFKLTRKYIEVAPADVIWSNLGMKAETMRIRTAISYSATAALIILWSIPVVLIGAVSNVSNLCKTFSWLAWLCDAPRLVIGFIQGVLPAVLLAALMKLLPVVLRLLSRFEGMPRRTGLELSLMTRYFMFLVIHSFLIVTLSSGLVAALPELLQNPTSIPALLAHELPKASTFFLTYVILQGLSGTGAGFLQISYFLVYYLKLTLVGSTPRALYNVKYKLKMAKFGEIFPDVTLLVVISIAYMVISPIINGLAAVTFFLFFEMYKYRFLYQLGQPASSDTGGLFFPRAIQQIFVGVYIQQICLCGLFFLARDQKHEPSAVPQAILMIALIFITMIYHSALNRAYNPLIRALPLTRADDSYKEIEASIKSFSDERLGLDQLQRTGSYDLKKHDQPTDFYHPATAEPIRAIWIPQDSLRIGIAESEVRTNKKAGISSGCRNAKMNEKGRVEVFGHPPGDPGPWMDGNHGD